MVLIDEQEIDYPKISDRTARPHVIVVGAGVAGMAAAHRLLERGHEVTLIEANSYLGGKLGAHQDIDEINLKKREQADYARVGQRTCPDCPRERHGPKGACCKDDRARDWHEHCYHMYLNWYHNFWQLMRDVGVIDAFEPMTDITWLGADPGSDPVHVTNPGSPATWFQNLTSGVAPPADLFIYSQILRDLLATSEYEDHRLDQMSVEAFMRGYSYSTEGARKASHRVLAKAFASPTALASAATYKSFLRYGARLPEPAMWLLNDHTQAAIFGPWLKKLALLAGRFKIEWVYQPMRSAYADLLKELESTKRVKNHQEVLPSFTFMPLTKMEGIEIDPDSGEFLLRLRNLDYSPTVQPWLDQGESDFKPWVWRFGGQVVLAIPPRQLAQLVHARAKIANTWYENCLAGMDPALVNTTRLAGAPIMTLDVVFKRPLDRPLPRGIVLLLESKYEMSLYDNAQMWTLEQGDAPGPPHLSICASDAAPLMPFVDQPGGPQTIVYLMLKELQCYFSFDPETDIYHGRTHLQTNAGAELFLNAVNSWHHRPRTTTAIPDLFIAGDFVQTPIDVVTVEAAAISGLMAAEAVRRRTGLGDTVPITLPDSYPASAMKFAAGATRPFAHVARRISDFDQARRSAFATLFPDP